MKEGKGGERGASPRQEASAKDKLWEAREDWPSVCRGWAGKRVRALCGVTGQQGWRRGSYEVKEVSRA